MGRPYFALACGALFGVGASAHAQVRPDAGSTQRDLEQRPLEAPRAAPPIRTEPARPALRADELQRFTVNALRVSGNTAFSSDTLLALVRGDLVGKTTSLKELQDAAARITAYYRERGYLVARAYIPAQQIAGTGAEVEIAVLEGVLGKAVIENRSSLSEATVARFAAPLRPGAPLTLDTFERPVMLLADQAGVGGVNPVLKAGERAGGSDLTLELAAAPLVSGQVELDNHGNRFTGQNRLTGQINLASPFGLGESFSARLIESFEGLTSATLRGAVPLGGDGWRIGASYSDTRYTLGKDFAALQASGQTKATGAFVSYPWVRTQRWNLNATLAVDSKKFEDRAAGVITPRKTDVASFTLGGDVRDPLVANSIFVWNVTALSGRLAINEPGARAFDATGAAAQGNYRKTTASVLYLQALSRDWSVYASVLGQAASKNLDSSEKFSLGGAQGVRAYPVGEAAGDEGALATLELRYALPEWLGATPQLVLFADSGRVRVSKNRFAAGNNARGLGAVGVGFTLVKNQDFAARLYWAAKTHGGPATADNDRGSRAWLQVAKYF